MLHSHTYSYDARTLTVTLTEVNDFVKTLAAIRAIDDVDVEKPAATNVVSIARSVPGFTPSGTANNPVLPNETALTPLELDEQRHNSIEIPREPPYPEATQRKEYPEDGWAIALLPDGTRVKYSLSTFEEIARKPPEQPQQETPGPVQPGSVAATAAAEYNAVNETIRGIQATEEFPHVQVFSTGHNPGFDIALTDTDGNRSVVPHKVIGLDPDITRKAYDAKERADVLNGATTIADVIRIVGPELKGSRDAIVKWCMDNAASVPVLASTPKEKLMSRVVRTLDINA